MDAHGKGRFSGLDIFGDEDVDSYGVVADRLVWGCVNIKVGKRPECSSVVELHYEKYLEFGWNEIMFLLLNSLLCAVFKFRLLSLMRAAIPS